MSAWRRLFLLAMLLLPAQAWAGVKENVAALAPSGLVFVIDGTGKARFRGDVAIKGSKIGAN